MQLDPQLFNEKCKATELQNGLKYFVKTSNRRKGDLIKDRDAIKLYLNEIKDNYHEFKFKNKLISLNNEQYSIVTADMNRHMRIVACAGSGKTTTILCRVKLLVDSGVEPKKILLMSFNVDACNQLRTKIIELFGFQPNIDICTIDSFSFRYYNMYKKEMGIDYNASVSEFCNIIAKFIQTRQGNRIAANYRYVFFDEFQDANEDQFNIIKQFSNACIVTVIGDDAQNIYTFRGTNVAYIMNFDKYIGNVNTYMLTKNYRSTPEIINIANESIKKNEDQIKKAMIAVNKSINKIPQIIVFNNVIDEYRYIIRQLHY